MITDPIPKKCANVRNLGMGIATSLVFRYNIITKKCANAQKLGVKEWKSKEIHI